MKIEDGCLVDVTIVETREERQLKEAKKARQSAPKPLRFCFVGKKQFTSDPILFLKRMAKGTVSNVRFDKYKATCHIIPADLQSALAEYMLSLSPPPAKVAKAFRKAIRQRRWFDFNPGTRKATKIADDLRLLIDNVDVEIASATSLWHAAIPLITGSVESVTRSYKEFIEFGPLVELEQAEVQRKIKATEAHKIQSAALEEIEVGVRTLVLEQLKKAVIRSRRKNSSTSESQKLVRKELSEIAKRLEALK